MDDAKTLEVVAWQHRKRGKSWGPAVVADFIMEGFERRSLTPRNEAQAAIDALQAENDRLTAEMGKLNVVFKVVAEDLNARIAEIGDLTDDRDSWRDQASARTDDAVRFAAERDALRKHAERYQWLRSRLPGSAFRIAGVIYSEGGSGVDTAIDAAMADAQGAQT